MAVFGDPYAANVREYKARKRRVQKAEARLSRQEQRLFDERMRQARKDREAREEIRRKAKIRDEAVEVRRDLIQTIARGKGVGIFGAKMPRINKFIIHTGTGRPGKNEAGFEAQIDPAQIKRLKSLAQTARDNEAARALSISTKGVDLPKRKAQDALADLATDYYPVYQADPAREAAGSGPTGAGAGPLGVTPTDTAGLGISPSGAGLPAGGDIDLTQLAQTGLAGPAPTPEQFQPGFEQGFQGVDEPAAPLENIHELIQSGVVGGQKGGGRSTKQEEYEVFARAMLLSQGGPPTKEQNERYFKAHEKDISPRDQMIIDYMRKRLGLDEPGAKTTEEKPKAVSKREGEGAMAGRPKGPRERRIARADLAKARRDFLRKHPNLTIVKIWADEQGNILIEDNEEFIWDVTPQG